MEVDNPKRGLHYINETYSFIQKERIYLKRYKLFAINRTMHI